MSNLLLDAFFSLVLKPPPPSFSHSLILLLHFLLSLIPLFPFPLSSPLRPPLLFSLSLCLHLPRPRRISRTISWQRTSTTSSRSGPRRWFSRTTGTRTLRISSLPRRTALRQVRHWGMISAVLCSPVLLWIELGWFMEGS